MKVSCDIIKDLLPLYHDGICSKDSVTFIEEHLTQCQICKAELEAMDTELIEINEERNLSEAKVVVNLSKKWKKSMLLSVIKGSLVTVIVTMLILLVLYLFLDVRLVMSSY